MVPVAVGEHEGLDRREIDTQPGDVLLEDPVLGSGVEEKGSDLRSPPNPDQAGEAVGGRAQTAARKEPGPAAPALEGGQLGLHERGGAGEIVGHVVDENVDLDLIDGYQETHAGILA